MCTSLITKAEIRLYFEIYFLHSAGPFATASLEKKSKSTCACFPKFLHFLQILANCSVHSLLDKSRENWGVQKFMFLWIELQRNRENIFLRISHTVFPQKKYIIKDITFLTMHLQLIHLFSKSTIFAYLNFFLIL